MGCNALKDLKLNIFKIIDRRSSYYFQNIYVLPRIPKIRYRYLRLGIQEFYKKYVLVPADKATNNVVAVRRLHTINTLNMELGGTKAYTQISAKEKSVINKPYFSKCHQVWCKC